MPQAELHAQLVKGDLLTPRIHNVVCCINHGGIDPYRIMQGQTRLKLLGDVERMPKRGGWIGILFANGQF